MILHGDRDTTVPLWNSQVLFDELAAIAAPVTLDVVPGAGHENAIVRGREAQILDFFERHVRPGGDAGR